jgi:hypothetical protein
MIKTRDIFVYVCEAIGLVLIIGMMWVAIAVAYSIINVPQAEERCFKAATSEMGYCRTQRQWEVK